MYRKLLRSAGVATVLAASMLSAPAALAGGEPDYPVGGVSVDTRVALGGDILTLGGSYWCEGAGDRLGAFSVDVYQAGGPVAAATVGSLICDGTEHAWQVAVQATEARPGRALAHGLLQVCESDAGPCPGVLFEEDVVLRPGR